VAPSFLDKIMGMGTYADFTPVDLIKPKKNIFKLKKESKSHFKHWAIILELSNGSYVNIQFGRNGFSLKEFNKTDVKGESILNSIICTWGEEEHPFSFCYLGDANYKYEKLKEKLYKIKNEEKKIFKEKGSTYYNLTFKNCQHFACDIEKILFGSIHIWHSFDYYIDNFYTHFFPDVNMDKLQEKYEEKLKKKNEELFKLNIISICKGTRSPLSHIEIIEKWYSLDYNYYLRAIDKSKLNYKK